MYWKIISLHMELDNSPLLDEGVDEEYLQTVHEKFIRNKKIPSLFALTTDDDEKCEDDDPSESKKRSGSYFGESTGSVNLSHLPESNQND